jgi:cathepsin B
LNEKARIKSEVAFQTLLSVADTTACFKISACFTFECDVGQVATPCDWLKKTGVVSGGSYGQDDFYYDYTMPMCAHPRIEFTTLLSCYSLTTVATFCGNSYPSNTSTDHASVKAESMSSYGVGPITSDTIMKEIFTYGSVIADFTIYEDLLTYGSGVYRHLTGTAEGHHAIKCIGWVV